MQKKPIDTFILTGFLGSGKTTLLNQLLDREKGKKNYVVENEFGKISVDGTLIEKNYNELFELNNGCMCCSLDGELVEILSQLIRAKSQPDNLFIEASGVADAGQLASIFKRDDVMKYFHLRQIICMVDAESFEDRLEMVPEITRQLVAADIILINKCDLVQESYVATIKASIAQINPFARILNSEFGKFDFELMLEHRDQGFIRHAAIETKQTVPGHRMKSIAIEAPEEFERSQLYVTLSMTMFLHYDQIYRIKGFVRIKGEENPVLVQSTGNKLSFTSYSPNGRIPTLALVFIGRDIDRKGIERILNRITPSENLAT